jgi:hypothetical protein
MLPVLSRPQKNRNKKRARHDWQRDPLPHLSLSHPTAHTIYCRRNNTHKEIIHKTAATGTHHVRGQSCATHLSRFHVAVATSSTLGESRMSPSRAFSISVTQSTSSSSRRVRCSSVARTGHVASLGKQKPDAMHLVGNGYRNILYPQPRRHSLLDIIEHCLDPLGRQNLGITTTKYQEPHLILICQPDAKRPSTLSYLAYIPDSNEREFMLHLAHTCPC